MLLGFEISKQCIRHLPLSYNSCLVACLMSKPEESPGVSARASWKPQPQPEWATSSLWLSSLFRNVWFFSSAASPIHHSVREQCSADPRWHSCGIVCSLGWFVTVGPLASSIVKPHSFQSAGVGFFVYCYLEQTTGVGMTLAHTMGLNG